MIVWHGIVNAFVTPPGLFLFVAAAGFLSLQTKTNRRFGLTLMVFAWVGLGLSSLPVVASALARQWESYPALSNPLPKGPQAIVVLAAGRWRKAPEYGHRDTVGADTLVRLRYGAHLFKKTRLPILVSGGAPLGGVPAAVLMRRTLNQDFRVPVKWVEDRSRTTSQNAKRSAQILAPLGVRRIFLVTQAWHMRRAVLLFRQAGFVVTPAPTDFVRRSRRDLTLLAYLPSAHAIALSATIFHEAVGVLWIRVRGFIPQPLAHFLDAA